MSGFITILIEMSLFACPVILAVILFRTVLKGSPKSFRCILWGLAALRLMCPILLQSPISIFPQSPLTAAEIIYESGSDTGAEQADGSEPKSNAALPEVNNPLTVGEDAALPDLTLRLCRPYTKAAAQHQKQTETGTSHL